MDLLVLVDAEEPPARIRNRATHVIRAAQHGMGPELIAHVRAHIPRTVGVINSSETATTLSDSGFAVTLYCDDPHVDLASRGIEVVPLTDKGELMEVADDVVDLIGNTPLVRLDRIAKSIRPQLIAKLEYLNPGGSVKDRPSVTMIEDAERRGLLREGGTIVEPTSGNTGVGLAIVAARKKYKCVFVVPDKVSQEKINLLRAYGAEVTVCPTAVAPEHPESYYSVSDRLAHEIPGAFKPDQYKNPANPQSHFETTGPEIWRQTRGRITHFVTGVGTAGTIVGIAKYLKSKNKDIQIIGADPEGSVYSGGTGRPYLVEGVGEDFFPENYDASVIDRVIAVSDNDSFAMARRMTREEGVFIGGSGGMAVCAALQLGSELLHEDVVVVLLPDSGRGYLSKVYSDAWLADYGFSRGIGPTAADLLAGKDDHIPDLVHVHPHETAREVAATMREFGVSSVIVVTAEPPLVMGEVVGSVDEEKLLRAAFADAATLDTPIGELMAPVPPTIGTGETVDVAISKLERSDLLLVVNAGHPVGIITRSDLLGHLAAAKK